MAGGCPWSTCRTRPGQVKHSNNLGGDGLLLHYAAPAQGAAGSRKWGAGARNFDSLGIIKCLHLAHTTYPFPRPTHSPSGSGSLRAWQDDGHQGSATAVTGLLAHIGTRTAGLPRDALATTYLLPR